MYSYQVVYEKTGGKINGKHEVEVIETSEWIVATNLEDVFVRAKQQEDDNYELIAIVRRNPIVSVLSPKPEEPPKEVTE